MPDCSIQLHYGDKIDKDSVRFHNDGPNSIIHLGLSISGQRTLLAAGGSTSDPDFFSLHQFQQTPGSVYVSSPFAMKHGPQYPNSSWKNRIIAVQCRILCTENDLKEFYKSDKDQDIVEVMTAIANAFRVHPIEIPTFSEVQRVAEELSSIL